ncbi:MAG: hypothetical protein IM548_07515 [Chitinophagaceae bacterium]|nr:hypothetical protein [Chitinophagaceae bacterium]
MLQNCRDDFPKPTYACNIALKDTKYSSKGIDNVEKTIEKGKNDGNPGKL